MAFYATEYAKWGVWESKIAVGRVWWSWLDTHTHTHTRFYKPASLHTTYLKSLHAQMHPCLEINACRIKIYSPTHSLNLRKHFQEWKALPAVEFFLPTLPSNQEIYFIIYSQLTGKSLFFSTWQTVCQWNSPCHVSLPLPTHAWRPSLLLLPLAPHATFVIDQWSNPVPTCSSSAYTSNEVLVV